MVSDLSCTISIFIDLGRCRSSPIKVGRFVCQPFDAAVGTGHCGGNGLLDFVCQGGGHFAQHAPTICVCQIGLELSQPFPFLLSTLELGDVGRTACKSLQISSVGKDGMANSVDPLQD